MITMSALFVALALLGSGGAGGGANVAGLGPAAVMIPLDRFTGQRVIVPTWAEVVQDVPVWSGPSLESLVVGNLVEGQEVRTIRGMWDRPAQGWAAVILPQFTGYVPTSAIDPV